MRSFLEAVQLLTILPVRVTLGRTQGTRINPTIFFPVIGLGIGILAASFDRALSFILPNEVRNVLVVIAFIVASGGLHLDGLADSADGFLSTRTKKQTLEIMKDGRSGPWAIAAVVCIIILKVALLGALPESVRSSGIVLMPLAGRTALTMLMGLSRYARAEGGMATHFERGCSPRYAVWASLFLFAAGWFLADVPGWVCAGLSIATVFILRAYTNRRIQGYTGDTLGAACEVVELAPVLALVVLGSW